MIVVSPLPLAWLALPLLLIAATAVINVTSSLVWNWSPAKAFAGLVLQEPSLLRFCIASKLACCGLWGCRSCSAWCGYGVLAVQGLGLRPGCSCWRI